MIARRRPRSSRPRRVALAARAAALVAAPALAVILSASSCGDDTTSTGPATGAGASTPTSSATTASGGGNGGDGGSGGDAGSGGGPQGCETHADCSGDPSGAFCEPVSHDCVECLPDDDQCDPGQYCATPGFTCQVGCTDASDCVIGGDTLTCDVTNHTCVGCLMDEDCPPGAICLEMNAICIPGCSPTQGCQAGFDCCETVCHNLQTDPTHCGGCDIQCGVIDDPAPGCGDSVCNAAQGESCMTCPGDCPCNAQPVCNAAMCGLGPCHAAFADCNGDPADGCEWNVLQDGPCLCAPGETEACYQGAPGTEDVGACHAGLRTCLESGNGWGPCVGDVYPTVEICGNGVDENCDGVVDNVVDSDGDGWTSCNGDCCELPGPGCVGPSQVNPGAFEVLGNGIDDDCDPTSTDMGTDPTCSFAESFASVTATDVAKAMDICQTTTLNPPIAQKKWGLISATQLLANGSVPTMAALNDMQNRQTAVLVNYGTGGIVPKKGATMAGISSGVMRDQLDAGYFGTSTSLTTTSQPPAPYLAQHAGALPASQGCSGTCLAGTGANDSVNIRLSIRVPSNAKGFEYDFRFTSSEYWIFQCTQYNDFYLALLQSTFVPEPGEDPIPADKNIAIDSLGNAVSVNNSFFEVCVPKGCNTCTYGIGPLASTGMQINNAGGGTAWLTNSAPVVPGETIQLEFMVFDVSDNLSDSLTLLDNFRWSLVTLGVEIHE